MGRSGLGLLRDDEGRAPQRWPGEPAGLYTEYFRSWRRTRPDELTRYAIGTTARPTLLPAHDWDGSPDKVVRHSLGYATLRGSGPEQRLGALEDSEADGSWWTKRSNGT
jgi:hypothetical protein